MERARDSDNKLTRFITGRRFVFITVPAVPLEKSLKVSFFSAKIYHKEQKLAQRTVVCSKCLETGHHVSGCSKDVVCRACKLSGHKRGDPDCLLVDSDHSRKEPKSASEERMEQEIVDSRKKESGSENGNMERESRGGGKEESESGGSGGSRREERESAGGRREERDSGGSGGKRRDERERGGGRKEERESGGGRREECEH
eukprot:TRINITY_DN23897_c0_g3_i2.p1 TRINITY_DN23897_c0_g3~~TRINITY_DN23897_c0_g3_i2.p1  ORF type:complete len:210 (+),score=35.25 TRINITY_DN23897_c0_g3_i2:29-631(+)